MLWRSLPEGPIVIDRNEVELLAKMAGLKIDPAHLQGVMDNLQALLDKGALLMSPPLAPEMEPAAALRL
jgi:hypothetical protein